MADIASRFGRVGAALQGNLAQHDEGIRRGQEAEANRQEREMVREQKQNQMLSDERSEALVKDSFTVMNQLRSGNVEGATSFLANRLDALQQLGGDPSDTMAVFNKIRSGDVAGALEDVSMVVDFAAAQGKLNLPEGQQPQHKIVDGQVVTIQPGGQGSAAPIEGFQESQGTQVDRQGRAHDRSLRERQIAVAEAAERRQAGKLSAGLEKTLMSAQDDTIAAQRNVAKYETLADDYERLNLSGGLKGSFEETLKGILGSQDDVTEFRREFMQVRTSQGLKNLPAGSASDADMKEAFRGVPPPNASAKQVASFLRGASKMARIDASYNQFKADFISNNETGKGLNQSWRATLPSEKMGRKVGVSEIYETAQNRGITPDEVAERLGIDLNSAIRRN